MGAKGVKKAIVANVAHPSQSRGLAYQGAVLMNTKAQGQLSGCVRLSPQDLSDRLLECDGGELQGFCPPVYIDSCLRSSRALHCPCQGRREGDGTQRLNAGRHVPSQLLSLCSVKKRQGKAHNTHSY